VSEPFQEHSSGVLSAMVLPRGSVAGGNYNDRKVKNRVCFETAGVYKVHAGHTGSMIASVLNHHACFV
jgi:hypothetical protein